MVATVILLRVLYRHHVANVFNHTNGVGVATRVGTDGAHLGVANIVAHLAVFYVMAQMGNGLCKGVDRLGRLAQQVQGEAKGCLSAYAWQLGQLVDSVVKQLR